MSSWKCCQLINRYNLQNHNSQEKKNKNITKYIHIDPLSRPNVAKTKMKQSRVSNSLTVTVKSGILVTKRRSLLRQHHYFVFHIWQHLHSMFTTQTYTHPAHLHTASSMCTTSSSSTIATSAEYSYTMNWKWH